MKSQKAKKILRTIAGEKEEKRIAKQATINLDDNSDFVLFCQTKITTKTSEELTNSLRKAIMPELTNKLIQFWIAQNGKPEKSPVFCCGGYQLILQCKETKTNLDPENIPTALKYFVDGNCELVEDYEIDLSDQELKDKLLEIIVSAYQDGKLTTEECTKLLKKNNYYTPIDIDKLLKFLIENNYDEEDIEAVITDIVKPVWSIAEIKKS